MHLRLLNWIKKEWFLVGMAVAMAVAVVLPGPGQTGGPLHLETVTKLGIALIFFFHGLALSPAAIRAGVTNWRLHLLTQGATFAIYPLLWLALSALLLATMPSALAFGFCYLLVLPSTISSSVAMTSIARGNVPGAIFNASLSSVLGVLITPFFVHLFMGQAGGSLDLWGAVAAIAQNLLLPMAIGQALRPLLRRVVEKRKAIVNLVDRLVILLIVYNAFCDSVVNGIWRTFSPTLLAGCLGLCVVVLLGMTWLIRRLAQAWGFAIEDEIAAVFCGTKKTLAAGVPMAQVLFAGDPRLGMLLLPIILYHPLQIFYCAMLANRYARRLGT